MRQGMTNHFRLFMDFLGHEMAVSGLVHQRRRGGGDLDLAIGAAALGVEDRDIGTLDDHHITFFQIGDAVGERRQREGVGADIGLVVGITDRQRRAAPGAPPAGRHDP